MCVNLAQYKTDNLHNIAKTGDTYTPHRAAGLLCTKTSVTQSALSTETPVPIGQPAPKRPGYKDAGRRRASRDSRICFQQVNVKSTSSNVTTE
jgi:hypothetical protein